MRSFTSTLPAVEIFAEYVAYTPEGGRLAAGVEIRTVENGDLVVFATASTGTARDMGGYKSHGRALARAAKVCGMIESSPTYNEKGFMQVV